MCFSAYFGLTESEVKFLEVRRDYDDGVLVYEFEFAKGYEAKYSGKVIADNGLGRIDKDIFVSSFIWLPPINKFND